MSALDDLQKTVAELQAYPDLLEKLRAEADKERVWPFGRRKKFPSRLRLAIMAQDLAGREQLLVAALAQELETLRMQRLEVIMVVAAELAPLMPGRGGYGGKFALVKQVGESTIEVMMPSLTSLPGAAPAR
jgi:hypothetical protein